MKIAILHEMLVKFGGAEKVVENFLEIFQDADLFTLIYDEKKMSRFFPKEKIHPQVFKLPSQKRYKLFKNQRLCLGTMARSVEQLDLSEYDIVLCSSSGFAHGAITKVETKFIVYYHSPARYMWDWTNEYKKDIGFEKGFKAFFLNSMLKKLRIWDVMASMRGDINIANSRNTQKRIEKYYRKQSHIIYPGVDTKRFQKKEISPRYKHNLGDKKYYIIISALTEFKKIDIAIDAFNSMPEQQLIIIGDGNYRTTLEKKSSSKNITFAGAQYDDDLVEYVQKSQGLIFPGEEDFGIVPIEVMAAGKPVFAYFGGGLKETVLAEKTGAFFFKQDGSDFIEKFYDFDKKNKKTLYTKENCMKQAEKFSNTSFEKQIQKIIFS